MIGQQAGRESVCSGNGRRGQSEPSERESEWWEASDGGDSSWTGGSLKENTTEEETERKTLKKKNLKKNLQMTKNEKKTK